MKETAPIAGRSPAYRRIEDLIAAGRCVSLDGGIGTEIAQRAGAPDELEESAWATRASLTEPETVKEVHRAYLAAGCDVITTNTWGLASWQGDASGMAGPGHAPVHWIDLARGALRVARAAVEESGRDAAVAFSLNGEVDSVDARESVRLLDRVLKEGPAPDLILVETLSVVRPSLLATVEALLEVGLPVWLSFRRCRHGLCGVYGEHWGGPEGDAFGRSAHAFEELGVAALLINCVPPDHIDGMVPFLRDFTDLPLGVYPNLGYLTDAGWQFDASVDPADYAALARRWRHEGAQIIGGCCGVRPEHIEATRAALEDELEPAEAAAPAGELEPRPGPWADAEPWLDGRGRDLFPLPFPELSAEVGVEPPDEAGLLAWRFLLREGAGAHQRCLDVGCGTGLLAVQLALNGAAHVRAIDIDAAAVTNTMTNAYRNGVEDRVSAGVVDLFPWTPEERFDLIVANLPQTPRNPMNAASSHRRADYWGRGLFDQLLAKLPRALAADGVAYVVQLSLLSQRWTASLLAAHGLSARVVDFTPVRLDDPRAFDPVQIASVEAASDAFRLGLGDSQAAVAYLLEIRPA
ncbi:MAG: homocysteine S-methyltransferase family protein [Actinobacteria bacterium]|nr:homocysteine S-methyltransferase family protein [Actinomycetota bacterium]